MTWHFRQFDHVQMRNTVPWIWPLTTGTIEIFYWHADIDIKQDCRKLIDYEVKSVKNNLGQRHKKYSWKKAWESWILVVIFV